MITSLRMLPERERAFLAEFFRVFPDAREVTEGEPWGRRVAVSASSGSDVSPSVTSQVSLFDQEAA